MNFIDNPQWLTAVSVNIMITKPNVLSTVWHIRATKHHLKEGPVIQATRLYLVPLVTGVTLCNT